jgi:hypothetical protein
MKYSIFTLLFFFVAVTSASFVFAQSVAENVRGKILLQVERHGEAWYIHPETLKRTYLGRPDDAFAIMRSHGIGITHEDLDRIPIAVTNTDGFDSDGDGLSDDFEKAYYLNPNNPDTDSDGFDDGAELANNLNPFGQGPLFSDTSFSKNHAGKIFLDVSNHGEAWYINPVDNKRYFLGRPHDAFALMRSSGLGITNNDLESILLDPLSLRPTSQIPDSLTNNLSDLFLTEDKELQSVYLQGAFVDCGRIAVETNAFTKGELEVLENELQERITCLEVRSRSCLPTYARIEAQIDDDLFNEILGEYGLYVSELFEITFKADYEIKGRNIFDSCEEELRVDEGRMLIVDQLFQFSNTKMNCIRNDSYQSSIDLDTLFFFENTPNETCTGSFASYFTEHGDRLNSAFERLIFNIFLGTTGQ